jgi:hypothetical protein
MIVENVSKLKMFGENVWGKSLGEMFGENVW